MAKEGRGVKYLSDLIEELVNGLVIRSRRTSSDMPNRTKERFARALFGIVCALVAWPPFAQARALRAAIFDFELIDTSLEGRRTGRGPMKQLAWCGSVNCACS
jgi:hypothetical protein